MTAVAKGTTTITATTTDGGKTAACAVTVPGIAWTTDIVTATTWSSGNTYLIDGTLNVSAKLTIEPGVTVKMRPYSNIGSLIIVGAAGQLVADGTSDSPITFTSDTAVPAAGDWGQVAVNGSNSSFTYCVFKYSGIGGDAALTIDTASNTTVANCVFTDNVRAIDAGAAGAGTSITGNSIYGNTGGTFGQYPVSINSAVAMDDTNTFTDAASANPNLFPGILYSGSIDANQTWASTKTPYVVAAVPTVYQTLTINPGVTVKFAKYSNYGAGLVLGANGQVSAVGTTAKHITFTSINAVTGTPAMGDWGEIDLASSNSSTFAYCDFIYSGPGWASSAALNMGNGNNNSVTNCSFSYAEYGIDKNWIGTGCTEAGNTFSNISIADYVP